MINCNTAQEVIEQYDLGLRHEASTMEVIKERFAKQEPNHRSVSTNTYHLAHQVCAYMKRTIDRRNECSSTEMPS